MRTDQQKAGSYKYIPFFACSCIPVAANPSAFCSVLFLPPPRRLPLLLCSLSSHSCCRPYAKAEPSVTFSTLQYSSFLTSRKLSLSSFCFSSLSDCLSIFMSNFSLHFVVLVFLCSRASVKISCKATFLWNIVVAVSRVIFVEFLELQNFCACCNISV